MSNIVDTVTVKLVQEHNNVGSNKNTVEAVGLNKQPHFQNPLGHNLKSVGKLLDFISVRIETVSYRKQVACPEIGPISAVIQHEPPTPPHVDPSLFGSNPEEKQPRLEVIFLPESPVTPPQQSTASD
ncbi:hypothetical protein Q8A73_009190 [Channa argus]|nr:hypothetical protein Q8A73_009190 [Channa argus]